MDDENPESLRDDHEMFVDAEFGELCLGFCNGNKSDVVELSCYIETLAYVGVKVAAPIDESSRCDMATAS